MFTKFFNKKMLILNILISPILIRAAERKNSFIAERSDGIVAVYCGERATKKRIMYPVLLLNQRKIMKSILCTSPVEKIRFKRNGSLYIRLENGEKGCVLVE